MTSEDSYEGRTEQLGFIPLRARRSWGTATQAIPVLIIPTRGKKWIGRLTLLASTSGDIRFAREAAECVRSPFGPIASVRCDAAMRRLSEGKRTEPVRLDTADPAQQVGIALVGFVGALPKISMLSGKFFSSPEGVAYRPMLARKSGAPDFSSLSDFVRRIGEAGGQFAWRQGGFVQGQLHHLVADVVQNPVPDLARPEPVIPAR